MLKINLNNIVMGYDGLRAVHESLEGVPGICLDKKGLVQQIGLDNDHNVTLTFKVLDDGLIEGSIKKE